jgi:hypothetical protein
MMTTSLNNSLSEFKAPIEVEFEEDARKGTILRTASKNFQVRRRHIAVFMITMILTGLDIGYTANISRNTLTLILEGTIYAEKHQ